MVSGIYPNYDDVFFERECRTFGKILKVLGPEDRHVRLSENAKFIDPIRSIQLHAMFRNHILPIKEGEYRGDVSVDAPRIVEKIIRLAQGKLDKLEAHQKEVVGRQARFYMEPERSRLLLKEMSKIYKTPVLKILNAWVAEPHGSERRLLARKRIISWIHGEGCNLDCSNMGLTSLPPIFHLLDRVMLMNVRLTKNRLTALPPPLLTLTGFALHVDSPTGGELHLGSLELRVLKVYHAYFLKGGCGFPIQEISQALEPLPKEIVSAADFLPTPDSARLSGKIYTCLGQKGELPAESYFLFREKAKYSSNAEAMQAKRVKIYPAIEPSLEDYADTLHRGPFAKLFYALGIRYHKRARFPAGEEEGGFLILPGIECLKVRWEELRKSATNIKLPALSFFSSEGIAIGSCIYRCLS